MVRLLVPELADLRADQLRAVRERSDTRRVGGQRQGARPVGVGRARSRWPASSSPASSSTTAATARRLRDARSSTCPPDPPQRDGRPIPWEACATMNDAWAYQRDDDRWKTGPRAGEDAHRVRQQGRQPAAQCRPDRPRRVPAPSGRAAGRHRRGGWIPRAGPSTAAAPAHSSHRRTAGTRSAAIACTFTCSPGRSARRVHLGGPCRDASTTRRCCTTPRRSACASSLRPSCSNRPPNPLTPDSLTLTLPPQATRRGGAGGRAVPEGRMNIVDVVVLRVDHLGVRPGNRYGRRHQRVR